MTQPTSVDMTFDTSLVDLNTSFSTTESDPSDVDLYPSIPALQKQSSKSTTSESTPKPKATQSAATASLQAMPPPPKPSTPVQHLPTQETYDQWASVYDTDGNMLQAIDDAELSTLLPAFLSTVLPSTSSPSDLHLLDLGCGTGRNTAKLLLHPYAAGTRAHITGLDFSSGMLSIAAQKLTPLTPSSCTLRLERADCFPSASSPAASPLPVLPFSAAHAFDAVLSTLVLEHVPLHAFFATLAALVRPGGRALVTNMHSDMGAVSQAGFVNGEGIKVRGESYAHTPEESVGAAEGAGFVVERVVERGVEPGDVESGIVGKRGNKWIGVKVWYGMVVRKP